MIGGLLQPPTLANMAVVPGWAARLKCLDLTLPAFFAFFAFLAMMSPFSIHALDGLWRQRALDAAYQQGRIVSGFSNGNQGRLCLVHRSKRDGQIMLAVAARGQERTALIDRSSQQLPS